MVGRQSPTIKELPPRSRRLAGFLALLLCLLCIAASAGAQHPTTPDSNHGAAIDPAPGTTHPGHGGEAVVAHGDDPHSAAHAEHGPALGTRLPLWSTLPFIGILLSIALFPLLAAHFWHRHFPKVSAFWAIVFAVPFLIAFGDDAWQSILHTILGDYVPFIILLLALFTTAGGIFVGGALVGRPRVNLVLLVIGTVLASWIGTTGAAMVMIRPLLRANAQRRYKVHTIVFFIFLVANIGGSLTPLGDPPLFLGFLHGVPFFWVTTGLLRQMVLVSILLLVIYYALDQFFYRREENLPAPVAGAAGIKVEGWHNLFFLAGIMGAVIFSGAVRLKEVHIYGHVAIEIQNWIRDGFLLLMAALSWFLTKREIRRKNEFSWFPIQEVGILFAGIFMTIIPALAILQVGEQGALASLIRAVTTPMHYFWITGLLSSFLDNAPTYLTFFNTALGSLGVSEEAIPGLLGYLGTGLRDSHFIGNLTAISAGAVFMGAMTYIGNAPNFMVKSIAEEAGIRMPSFFGFLVKYSLPILIPCFLIVTLVFFR